MIATRLSRSYVCVCGQSMWCATSELQLKCLNDQCQEYGKTFTLPVETVVLTEIAAE